MSSNYGFANPAPAPVKMFQYRDIANSDWTDAGDTRLHSSEQSPSQQEADSRQAETELAARMRHEAELAVKEAEQRIRREYEEKIARATSSLATALKAFEDQKNDYFSRVEGEVVQLALAISAKILHREAQVDPMLVAALVRLAIERMHENTAVTVRVNPARAAEWKNYFSNIANLSHVEVIADDSVSQLDCFVGTELGSANFGLDTQLKEVEQGFLDLLALRPSK